MTNPRTIILIVVAVVLALGVLGASFFAAYRNRVVVTPTPSVVVEAPTNPCLGTDGTQRGVFTSFETALAQPLEVCGFLIAGQGVLVIPPQITTLQNVQVINMLDNELTEVPAYLSELKELRILILSGNNIATLPAELGQLPKLEVIHLLDNPVPLEEQARLRQQMPNVQLLF